MRSPLIFPLFANVTSLTGVGAALAKTLARLITGDDQQKVCVRDLVFHLPSSVIDRRYSPPLFSAPADTVCTFIVKVEEHYPPPLSSPPQAGGRWGGWGSKKPYRVLCSNDTGDLTIVFFHPHPDYINRTLPIGETRVVSGRTEKFDFRLQMTHPDFIVPVSEITTVEKVEPQYPLTAGLTNRKLTSLIEQALARLPDLPEWIEPDFLARKGWPSWREALIQLHHPTSESDVNEDSYARLRLAYDELLAMQLHLASIRAKAGEKPGIVLAEKNTYWPQLVESLPFALTASQNSVTDALGRELATGQRVVKLLQGDVGSGKTLVALFAMLRAAENNMQAALMVPTEMIAFQHYETLRALCEPLGVEVGLLTGSVKGAERTRIMQGIADGTLPLIVGTHALFQEKVRFDALALVIIDEQHRFGVGQRMALTRKGDNPHILHMTATPIPRSLMMTVYGDMETAILTDKPAGRKPIATRVIPLSRYEELLGRLGDAIARGEKAYWICPLIEENPSPFRGEVRRGAECDSDRASPSPLPNPPCPPVNGGDKGEEGEGVYHRSFFQEDVAAAESRFIEFKTRFGDCVGMVHGRMFADERTVTMQRFAKGDCSLLVATTVVEVGVDIRDATIMIIERAERFGLSQIHQLRGRVGRGDKESYCILLYSDAAGEIARERLTILRETEDGFRIAEADLGLRGGGELLGTRQTGIPRFHFASLFRHGELLQHARETAPNMLPALNDPTAPHYEAYQVLRELYRE